MKDYIQGFITEREEWQVREEGALAGAKEILIALEQWQKKNLDKNFFLENFTREVEYDDGRVHEYTKYQLSREVNPWGTKYHLRITPNETVTTTTRSTAEMIEQVKRAIVGLEERTRGRRELLARIEKLDLKAIEEDMQALVTKHGIPTQSGILREMFKWASYNLD